MRQAEYRAFIGHTGEQRGMTYITPKIIAKKKKLAEQRHALKMKIDEVLKKI